MEDGWLYKGIKKMEWKHLTRNGKTMHEEGFGDLNGDKLWYRLKALNCFTETGQWELRIDFQFDNKTWSHLHYKQFKVGSSSAEHPLTIGGFTGITPTDPFVTSPLNNMKFTTTDNDNDHEQYVTGFEKSHLPHTIINL